MHARRWTTTTVLALACGRSEPQPDPAAAAPVTTIEAKRVSTAEVCTPVRAEENEALLLRSCTPPVRGDVRKLALARWESTLDPAEQDGVFVELGTKGVTIDGASIEPELLAASVLERIESARAMQPESGFVLAIDADATLGSVQSVLDALVAAKASHGTLLFGSATKPRTPRPAYPEQYAPLAAGLEAEPPEQRAMWLARGLEQIVQPCAPLVVVFGSVAADAPEGRCERLMKGAAQALVECGCPSWEPEVISYLQLLGGPADAPQMHAETVELDPTRPITAHRELKWSSFVHDRREPLGRLWLALEP